MKYASRNVCGTLQSGHQKCEYEAKVIAQLSGADDELVLEIYEIEIESITIHVSDESNDLGTYSIVNMPAIEVEFWSRQIKLHQHLIFDVYDWDVNLFEPSDEYSSDHDLI